MISLHFPLPSLCTFVAVLSLAATGPILAQDKKEGEAAPAKPIAEQILGAWSIDVPKTLAAMIRQEKKRNGGKEIDEVKQLRMLADVEGMAKSLQLEFKPKGLVQAHQSEKVEEATYKIVKEDPATGVFKMTVQPADEDNADTAHCMIQGESLVMGMEAGKIEIHFGRLTKEEAAAHLAKMKEPDGFDKDLTEDEPESKPEPAPVEKKK